MGWRKDRQRDLEKPALPPLPRSSPGGGAVDASAPLWAGGGNTDGNRCQLWARGQGLKPEIETIRQMLIFLTGSNHEKAERNAGWLAGHLAGRAS